MQRGRDWKKAKPRYTDRGRLGKGDSPALLEGQRLSRLTFAERVDLPRLQRAHDSWLAKLPAGHPFLNCCAEGGRGVE